MNDMWIEFDNDRMDQIPIGNYPPEGYEVGVTDGKSEMIMWYVMSGEYEWYCDNEEDPDYPLSGEDLPFKPTHWMHEEDYKKLSRDKKIDELIK